MTFAGCADRLILHPSTEPRRFNGIERRDFTLPSAAHVEIWTARTPAVRNAEPLLAEFEQLHPAPHEEFWMPASAETGF